MRASRDGTLARKFMSSSKFMKEAAVAEFLVGFPVQAYEIREHGLSFVFDRLQEAGVNHIMFNAQDPEGCFYVPDESYFSFTRLKPQRNSRVSSDVDYLGEVCEEGRKRGIPIYGHNMPYEAAWPGYWPGAGHGRDRSATVIRNFTACSQIDLFGRKNFRPCTNHPDYRQYWLSSLENQLRSYPLAGIKWNVERNGPLSTVLVGHYPASFHYRKPMAPVCFCEHCLAKAKQMDISIDRARQGFAALLDFSERSWLEARAKGDEFAGEGRPEGTGREVGPPPDGYYIEFIRILMKYPEILHWNRMWYESLLTWCAEIYGLVKLINHDLKLGVHIWHHRAFSVFERAMYDYAEICKYVDWIKPKMDHTVAGFRYRQDVRRYHQALFYDRDFEKSYEAWSTMLGWESEGPSDALPTSGMSLDYIRRDTATAIRAVNGAVPIYPGIGINIPSPTLKSTPQSVQDALWAAYSAGVTGVLLARSFREAEPQNLRAAGQALAEIKRDFATKGARKAEPAVI